MAPRLNDDNYRGNNVERYIQEYTLNNYTEEMYRDQTIDMYDTLRNIYHIQHPNNLIQLDNINSYRNVLILYTRQVPLFELEAFGI
jgi:hypothetical protein